MKKIKYLTFIMILMLIPFVRVDAKKQTTGICEYSGTTQETNYKTGVVTNVDYKITCEFYGYNDNADCNISLPKKDHERIKNFKDVKVYLSTHECLPSIVFISGAAGFEVYGATSTEDSFHLRDKYDASCVGANKANGNCQTIVVMNNYTATGGASSSEMAKDKINEYINYFETNNSKDDFEKYCDYKGGKYRPAEKIGDKNYMYMGKCQALIDQLDNKYKQIKNYIDDQVRLGNLTENMDIVKKLRALMADYTKGIAMGQTIDLDEIPDGKPHDTGSDIGTDSSTGCEMLGGSDSDTVKLLSWAVRLIRFGIPVLIVILGMMDFLKILFSGEDKVFKQAFSNFTKRVFIGIIFIFVPYILYYLVSLSGVKAQYGIDSFFCGIIDATSGVTKDDIQIDEVFTYESDSCNTNKFIWVDSSISPNKESYCADVEDVKKSCENYDINTCNNMSSACAWNGNSCERKSTCYKCENEDGVISYLWSSNKPSGTCVSDLNATQNTCK